MADLETRVDKLEGRVSTLEINVEKLSVKVDALSDKIDDFIAESRAARAETKEELKEMRANRKISNQRMDKNLESFKILTRAVLIEVIVMDIAIIAAILFK